MQPPEPTHTAYPLQSCVEQLEKPAELFGSMPCKLPDHFNLSNASRNPVPPVEPKPWYFTPQASNIASATTCKIHMFFNTLTLANHKDPVMDVSIESHADLPRSLTGKFLIWTFQNLRQHFDILMLGPKFATWESRPRTAGHHECCGWRQVQSSAGNK